MANSLSIERAVSNPQNDAQLIVGLLVDFRSKQDPTEGYWKESGPAACLRLTCHILEALYLLDPDALRTTLDNGLSWLVNLSEGLNNGHTTEDILSVCQHPSRFKTLIWLNQFTDPEIHNEFRHLGDRLSGDGLLQSIQIDPILGSMIYLDGLLLLEKEGEISAEQMQHKGCILSLLNTKVAQWFSDLPQAGSEHLNEGTLSYAFDLLVRAQELEPESEVGEQVQRHLCQYIVEHRRDRPLDSDVLYCAIHLISHFPHKPPVNSAVWVLIETVRQKYLTGDFHRESSSFDPLYMRLLFQARGPQLKSEIMNLLLQSEHTHLVQRNQRRSARRQAAFDQVVKNRIRINIREETALTGGLTKAEVFRVKFQVYLQGMGKESTASPVQITGDFTSMVIKIDTLNRLLKAIACYETLPPAVKPYFATHVGPPTTLNMATNGEAYLVLEDLTDQYDTFRTIVDKYDRRRLSTEHRQKLWQACDVVLDQLFEIYEHSRQSASAYSGFQVYRLYLGRMERALIEGAKMHPHFKSWYQGFWLTDKYRFPGIEYYNSKLDRFKEKLRVKHLMLVHGDCHTRNIMIDDCYEHIKLIDLDRVADDGDYIQDIAMLIEDIAIFRFVFDPDYTNFIDLDSVTFPAHDKEGIEHRIDYVPFTSRTVVDIQQHIMDRVEAYAQVIGDNEWRARLWLALAVHLLRLVEKQEEPKRASILYVEAIKLLDVLEQSLENQQMPAGVPFPGTHGATEEAKGEQALWPQAAPSLRDNLLKLHRAIINDNNYIQAEINRNGSIVRYYRIGVQFPILIINTERSPIQIRLAANPEFFEKFADFVCPYKTKGPLRTLMAEAALEDTAIALGIVHQANAQLSDGIG